MGYYLYILKSEKRESYYIGISADPWRRIEYHNHANKGFTRKHRPLRLIFTEAFDTKEKALIAEKKVKNRKSKKMIQKLVQNEINIHDYL